MFGFFEKIEINSIFNNRGINLLSQSLAHSKKINIGTTEKRFKETLVEHMNLTIITANFLIEQYHLSNLIENLIRTPFRILFKDYSKVNIQFYNFFKDLVGTVIYFHDIGKINPLFQAKLKNDKRNITFPKKLFSNSNHSALSSLMVEYLLYLKINQFFKNHNFGSNRNNERLKINLFRIIIIFNTINAFHHTSLKNIFSYLKSIISIKNWKDILNYFSFYLKFYCDLEKYIEIRKKIVLQSSIVDMIKKLRNNPEDNMSLIIFYRVAYSLLLTSDYYATYLFMSNENPYYNEKNLTQEMGLNIFNFELKQELLQNFYNIKSYNHILKDITIPKENGTKFSKNLRNSGLNSIRSDLLLKVHSNILNSIQNKKRILFLNVPTGGGKTNIAIDIMLQVINKRSTINRAFYVFPFINIIEQNYDVIKNSLVRQTENKKSENIFSKIYSYSEWNNPGEDDELYYINQTFLNYPINIITNVNFFNTFFKAQKTTNYKLINLCNSVVVIDEIHTIPTQYWDSIINTLTYYAKNLNFYVVLMSATLPNLSLFLENTYQTYFTSLIKHPEFYQNLPQFSRVKYMFHEKFKDLVEDLDIDYIKNNIKAEIAILTQKKPISLKILIVVNTIANSRSIFKKLDKLWLESNRITPILLNSTLISEIKSYYIDKINQYDKKREDKHLLIISTQTIEAGVDIDCNFGFREYALIDSIEQVAGRINREGERLRQESKLYVFPSNSINIVYSSSEKFKIQKNMKSNEIIKILKNRDFNLYYKRIIENIKQEWNFSLNKMSELSQYIFHLEFKTASLNFNYIDNDNLTLYLPISLNLKEFPLSKAEKTLLSNLNLIYSQDYLKSKDIWHKYKKIAKSHIKRKIIEIKKINTLLNKFTISIRNYWIKNKDMYLSELLQKQNFDFLNGIYFLPESVYHLVYTIETGLDLEKFKEIVSSR